MGWIGFLVCRATLRVLRRDERRQKRRPPPQCRTPLSSPPGLRARTEVRRASCTGAWAVLRGLDRWVRGQPELCARDELECCCGVFQLPSCFSDVEATALPPEHRRSSLGRARARKPTCTSWVSCYIVSCSCTHSLSCTYNTYVHAHARAHMYMCVGDAVLGNGPVTPTFVQPICL